MSVQGNVKPPYHAQGRRSCEARLLENCRKLQALAGEAIASTDRMAYQLALGRIESEVRWMAGAKLEWEGQEG